MKLSEQLEPSRVFYYFEEIAAIPHGSKNTKAISDYCVDFARAHGLTYYQDDANNVIMIKEASKGCEAKPAVIIQGHLDMVCEKEAGCRKNMDTEGLDLFIDGEMLGARCTTLGGDDGIAIAMALAILEDDSLRAPRIEAVFTTDEEIGMLGAQALDVSVLKGRRLLNIDSEVEGIFTVSCAGGLDAECSIPLYREETDGQLLRIEIGGLTGGHSGIEIHEGRANANVLMGELLNQIYNNLNFLIVDINGGLKSNAIPTSCTAHLLADDSSMVINRMGQLLAEFRESAKAKYADTDPGLFIEYNYADEEEYNTPLDKESTDKVLHILSQLPDGVQKMSEDVPGLVETSLNNGILVTSDEYMDITLCIRSSIDAQRDALTDRIKGLLENKRATLSIKGKYPGWAYLKDSPLRDLMVAQFTALYGHAPSIEAVHAGVECGIFAGKLPGLDAVSYGPDLLDIHTCRERMDIASVERTYKLTCSVLENM